MPSDRVRFSCDFCKSIDKKTESVYNKNRMVAFGEIVQIEKGCFIMIEVKGLSPTDNGVENVRILQNAIDCGGEISVSTPGVYRLSKTVLIGDHTHIRFGEGVYFVRVHDPDGINGNAFINRGAFSGEVNVDITIEGLWLNTADVEHCMRYTETDKTICGLRGHLAFLYVRDLVLRNIVILDLYRSDYGIQISDFSNVLVENIRIEGNKDGIHFGPGKGFVVRGGVFRTFDDPIALNGSDYSVSNPNLGWIEDGLFENCYDLDDNTTTGFFARMLCGGWRAWFAGMEVQHSDAVVHNGVLYRVVMRPDGSVYRSDTPPTHAHGFAELDGIVWHVIHYTEPYTAGARNITFRNIYLQKTRESAFGFILDKSEYLRSCYPGAEMPLQHGFLMENIHVTGNVKYLFEINAPLADVTVRNSTLGNAAIHGYTVETEGLVYPDVTVSIENCTSAREELLAEDTAYPIAVKRI